ncbi:MAG: hypothetical protein KBG47_00275 [Bacteroidia bacterium]|nr:hypothetical protein [Bacteroidia bacterium]
MLPCNHLICKKCVYQLIH